MTTGDDRVIGELWQFGEESIDRVLAVLDRIEGANQPGRPDLYRRLVVDVWVSADQPFGTAWTYHYVNDPSSDGFVRIEPAEHAAVRWPS